MRSPGPRYYILNVTGEPEQVRSMEEWLWWFAEYPFEQRQVDYSKLPDGIEISTVFVGIDTDGRGAEPPIYETRIIGGPNLLAPRRFYSTREQAKAGHASAVRDAQEYARSGVYIPKIRLN